MYFDGTGDYLTMPDSDDWDLGTGDFTIDFWLYHSSLTGYQEVIEPQDTSWKLFFNSNDGRLYFNHSSPYFALIAVPSSYGLGNTFPANVWRHWAIVRHNEDISVYMNGTKDTNPYEANPENFGTSLSGGSSGLAIGRYGASGYLNGYIDELRVSKGIARWTSNFTPPTSPHSSFSTFNTDSIGNDISNHDIHFPSNPSEDPCILMVLGII
jgi:hypothetical protein